MDFIIIILPIKVEKYKNIKYKNIKINQNYSPEFLFSWKIIA